MKLAVSNIAWTVAQRLDAYAILADAGFGGLEIAPGLFFDGEDDVFCPSETAGRRALAEIRAAGLELVSMQALLFGVQGAALFGAAPERARFRTGLERAIDLAGRFGIPNLVFGSPAQRRIPDGLEPDEARLIATDMFRDLGMRAAAAGTVIAIEANPVAYGTNFLNTLEQARAFVETVAHPSIKVILDVGAMVMNAESSVVTGLAQTMPMLSHVHLSQPQLAPALASVDQAAEVLSALNAARYSGAVSIEMKQPPGGLVDLRTCVAALAQAAKQLEWDDMDD
ncbi:MAG: sugar phosphate isomerase/epimerase family protein [bacterium]